MLLMLPDKPHLTRFHNKPEVEVLLNSLTLLKDFGYSSFWENDDDLFRSFRIGACCDRYHDFICWLEMEMELYLYGDELIRFKQITFLLRNSYFDERTEDVPTDPLLYRLSQANVVVNRLLELYLNDLNNPQSRAMEAMIRNYLTNNKNVCGETPRMRSSGSSSSHGHGNGSQGSSRERSGHGPDTECETQDSYNVFNFDSSLKFKENPNEVPRSISNDTFVYFKDENGNTYMENDISYESDDENALYE